MSQPWEDFGGTTTNVGGPWEDFQAKPSANVALDNLMRPSTAGMVAQAKAGMADAQGQISHANTLANIGAMLYNVANPVKQIINQPGRIYNAIAGRQVVPEFGQAIPAPQIEKAIQTREDLFPERTTQSMLGPTTPFGRSVTKAEANILSGLSDIDVATQLSALGAGGGSLLANIYKALVGGTMASQIPQQAATAMNSNLPGVERGAAALEGLAGGLGTVGVGMGIKGEPIQKTDVTPTEYSIQNLAEQLPMSRVYQAKDVGFQPVMDPVVTPQAPRTSATDVPIIGQRPVQMENQIITPTESASTHTSKTKYYSGPPVDPEDLRPALRVGGRIIIGERGDTHADIGDRNGVDIPYKSPDRGFVSVKDPTVWMSRTEAQTASGLKGTGEMPGLDSQDLPQASMHRLMRQMETVDIPKGKQNDTQNQQRIQGGESQGQEPRTLQDQGGGTAQVKTGGVLEEPGKKPVSDPTTYHSGIPVPDLNMVWDKTKKVFQTLGVGTKDWSPFTSPEKIRSEILNNPTAKPMTSKVAGMTLPTEGAKTTLADRAIGVQNTANKTIASAYDLANKGDKVYSPMDVIFDQLDGGKATYDGPLFHNIRYPLDYDFNLELNLRDKASSPVKALVKQYDLKEKNGLRLGIYAMVQQGARQRLIENGVPANYIDNIVKTITPQELDVYRAARRQLDSLLPSVQRTAKDVYGMDVKPVSNYFPMQRDWRDIPKEPAELAKPGGGATQDDAVTFLNMDFTKAGTKAEQGFTVQRVPDAKTAVKLNFFDVFDRHVKDVAHFVSSQKRLNEIAKIVRSDEFQQKYGDYGQKLVMDWLNTYAKQGRTINSMPQLNWLRKAYASSVLGFRVASQFVHLANVPLGMQRAGLDWYRRGLTETLTDVGQEFLKKNLAETFERGGGEMEVLESKGPVGKAAFGPQRFLDRYNSQATSLGIYLRKLKEAGQDPSQYATLPVNQQALAEARVLTRRAVASPLYKDIPPALKSTAGKLLLQFQNTFMDQWSNIRYDLPQYLRNDPKQAMGLATALAAMVMVESGIKHESKKAIEDLTGYHPKNDETYWQKVAQEGLRRIPGAGQIIASYEYGTSPVPIAEAAGSVMKSAKNIISADEPAQRTLGEVQLGTAAVEMTGIPGIGQASEIAQDVLKGKMYKSHEQRVGEVAKKEGLDTANFEQRVQTEKDYQAQRPPMTEGERVKSAEGAMKKMEQHRKAVYDGLSKEDKAWLKTYNIRMPGFGDSLTVDKTRVAWTEDEAKAAQDIYRSEYETVIANLRNDPGFKQMEPNEQQVEANGQFKAAVKEARALVTEAIENGTLVKKKAKRRFSVFNPE